MMDALALRIRAGLTESDPATHDRRGARWRLYAWPDGTITARPLTRRRSVELVDGRYYIWNPLPVPSGAVALLDYRDAPDAIRSRRWGAALSWAIHFETIRGEERP
jgi:hypothetical protein